MRKRQYPLPKFRSGRRACQHRQLAGHWLISDSLTYSATCQRTKSSVGSILMWRRNLPLPSSTPCDLELVAMAEFKRDMLPVGIDAAEWLLGLEHDSIVLDDLGGRGLCAHHDLANALDDLVQYRAADVLDELLNSVCGFHRSPQLKAVHSSTSDPSGQRRYETDCPQGLRFGAAISMAPACSAVAWAFSTSSAMKASSTPSGCSVWLQ